MNITKKLLIATHNKAKLQEFEKLLHALPYRLFSLDDVKIMHDVEEMGTTFEQNAVLKAVEYARMAHMLALADDGGLEIDALNGQPGVYSSRYAGQGATDEQKVDYILKKMSNIPSESRQAQFTGVIALASPDGQVEIYEGTLKGVIATEPRGKLVAGFPYRQIFLLPEFGKTLSELDQEGIVYASHRQRALQEFLRNKK